MEHTDRAVNRMTWIAGVAMTIITLLIGVGVGLGIYGTISLPGEVVRQVSEQVPPSVNNEVSRVVPDYVETEINKRIPTYVFELNSTVVAQVVPTPYSQVQTQSYISAATAVNQSLGNYTIAMANSESLDIALSRASYARNRGYKPTIYKMQQWYVTTIGTYYTKEQLNIDLAKIRIELAKDAYMIDLRSACANNLYDNWGFYICIK
jgi:hypothetical protein